uniref:Uncharacterized protein n=1 Tax=Clandestinovirus TaxID=2831644 RepID=A0A8F8PKK6_9VIRU|nr:hypothetical protein KOM_12_608 [Clandestinovirus]
MRIGVKSDTGFGLTPFIRVLFFVCLMQNSKDMAHLNRRSPPRPRRILPIGRKMLASHADHDYVGNVLGLVLLDLGGSSQMGGQLPGYDNKLTTGLLVMYKDRQTLYLRRDGEFLDLTGLSNESMKTMKITGGLYKGPPNSGGSSQLGGRNVLQVKDMLLKN